MVGRLRVDIDPHGAAVRGTEHKLLPEISEDIRDQTGISLCPVVGERSFRPQQNPVDIVIDHPGLNILQIVHAVNDLRSQIPRPADALVRSQYLVRQPVSSAVIHLVHPHGKPSSARSHISHHTAAKIAFRILSEKHLSCFSIPQRPAIGCVLRALINVEYLKARPVRIDHRHMHGVPVPQLCPPSVRQKAMGRIQQASIMVDHRRPVDDFLAAVSVHVRRGQAVISLSRQTSVYGIASLRLMGRRLKGIIHRNVPAVNIEPQTVPSIPEIIGSDGGSGIIPAADDETGPLPVQIGYAGQETVHPVAWLDPPHGIIPPAKPVVLTGMREWNGFELPPVASEHGQVFRSLVDKTFKFPQTVLFTSGRGEPIHKIIHKLPRVFG